jgi:hypothetical protein
MTKYYAYIPTENGKEPLGTEKRALFELKTDKGAIRKAKRILGNNIKLFRYFMFQDESSFEEIKTTKKVFTPHSKINKYIVKKHIFKNLEEAQKYIRKNGTPDLIAIDNILYTMEEYDMSGKEIYYHNMRTGNTLFVRTSDRYEESFGDAELELIENYGVSRNDLTFYD